jgi:hypothetical protein
MASKNLYYNNDETVQKIITQKDLDEHNTSSDAHSEKFNNYTLSSPTGIWSAITINPNYTPDIQSTEGFASIGTFICTYDAKDCFFNQPSQYGTLLNIPSVLKKSDDTGNAVTVIQLWFSQNGDIYSRAGTIANNISMQKFTKILFTSDKFPARSGSSFNYTNVEIGQLFYRTDEKKLYIYIETTSTTSAGTEYIADKWVDINELLNLDNCQEKLTFDTTPTSGSTNPVTSDGIYTAITTAISSAKTTVDTATNTTAGITKVYTSTGANTDGTMTQAAITTAISNGCNQIIVPYPRQSSEMDETLVDGVPLFMLIDTEDPTKSGVTAYPRKYWTDFNSTTIRIYFIGPSINNHIAGNEYYVLKGGVMTYMFKSGTGIDDGGYYISDDLESAASFIVGVSNKSADDKDYEPETEHGRYVLVNNSTNYQKIYLCNIRMAINSTNKTMIVF